MSERIQYQRVAPDGYKALIGVHGYVAQCGLDATLVDLVYLRVSLINGCAFCIDLHTSDLRKRGVAIEKIALVPVWHEAKRLFSEREQAALAWAESVTRVARTGVPDSDYQAAIGTFSEKELADLTIAIGLMNTFNRLSVSFRNPPAAVLAARG